MLNNLQIEGFRGLTALSFEPLSRVNVITGFNNAGKTTVLEALYLLFAQPKQLHSYADVFRGAQDQQAERFEHFWRWLLPEGDLRKEASVFATADDNRRMRVTIKAAPKVADVLAVQYVDSSRGSANTSVNKSGFGAFSERPWPKMEFFSPRMQSPTVDAERYNKVQLVRDGEEKLLELMRVIEPRLRKLRYAKATQQALVYCDIGLDSLIPASQMGQAFCRLLTLYMQMLVSGAEILLIDEIENGLHIEVLDQVWLGLAGLSRSENAQVFVTTHSKECVLAASKAARYGEDHGFSHHRLERHNGGIVVNSSPEVFGRTIPPGL